MVHDVVIGVDGGGSQTRVMVSDLTGNILSYAVGGASSIHKDSNAHVNVQRTIQSSLAMAGCSVDQVKGLYAGIAGYESDQDLEWVTQLTDVEGLDCPKWYVNDSLVAHAGAFIGQPGIVVVSGTGSMILAITEQKMAIKNIDFHHYAASAARFLAYDAVYQALAGNTHGSDETLIRDIQSYWGVNNLEQLRFLAAQGFVENRMERNKKFGEMAPMITDAAEAGSYMAQIVCDRAIGEIMVGVEILGSYFQSAQVSVTGIGSVMNCSYMRSKFADRLQSGNNKQYDYTTPELSAVSGAVLKALQSLGISIEIHMIESIRRHPNASW
ncbi:N-acetylglucosamine kinase [Paenibacillus sp. JCM 10914]|uniref:N-acetylglucosamine kinase n=1 Tax=Paenibacillus sp. JCM 10914 TaxID=1236974 RepID=UPI0003CC59B4|nr:BadF/BadG/BcrA/BcrD ATPase family protein [Paenibacillus sp. JCM 10914]GAE07443.1 kinase similar to eukaryotic-like N-acetylglucosamine kinase [Paenibacillus sp. JCM 10914]